MMFSFSERNPKTHARRPRVVERSSRACAFEPPTGPAVPEARVFGNRFAVGVCPAVAGLVGGHRTLLAVAALALLVGCDGKTSAKQAPSASASAAPRSCKASCKMAGLCTWDGTRGRCIASSNEGCAASNSCKTSGLCAQEGTVCVGTSAQHCQQSSRCKTDGICTFTGKGIFPCRAQGKDCVASKGCKRKGKCTAVHGQCEVADDDDCARSEACVQHGLCSAKPSWRGNITVRTCTALSNEDCKRGKGCLDHGLCTAASGSCR